MDNLQELYEQEGLVRSPAFSLPSLVGLARQVGAGVLIQGGFKAEDSRVVASLSAYDLTGNVRLLGRWEESASLAELPDLTRKLGEAIFGALGHPWVASPPVSPQAFESYIRGRIAEDATLQEVYFRKALEIQPDYLDAQCHLALVLKDTGRVTESSTLLVALEGKAYPKAYLGLLTLAEIRMDQGQITEARRLLMSSLKAAESPEAHIVLATWNLKQKKLKEASMELVMAEKFGTHQDDIDALRRQILREGGKPGTESPADQPAAPEAVPQPSPAAPPPESQPAAPTVATAPAQASQPSQTP
jgi:tetratricopeptide (TPR) repeat protein